jgi:hypothetical protein
MPKLQLTDDTETQELATTTISQPRIGDFEIPGVGSIASVRQEVDDALADMRAFYQSEPDQVIRAISGHAARLTEISITISRYEVQVKALRPVREEIDRVIKSLGDQFNYHSRLLSSRQLDYETSRM